jgi:hypothetical protein
MLNVTWVIDFGWSASPSSAVRVAGATSATLRAADVRRQRSREMFATTRALLAEARAVLAAPPLAGRTRAGSRPPRGTRRPVTRSRPGIGRTRDPFPRAASPEL